jgi:hypothetical protein
MSALVNAVANQAQSVLLAPVSKTASFTTTPLDISDFEGLIAITQVGGVGSTWGTAATIVETSDDVNFAGGANPTVTVGTFTTVAANAAHQKIHIDTNACKRYIRCNSTFATLSAWLVAYLLTGVKQTQ